MSVQGSSPCLVVVCGRMEFGLAWKIQRRIHGARTQGTIQDVILFTEHPHTYTIGRSGTEEHLLADYHFLRERGISLFRIDRGGDITYHGPGQLVGYPIIDLTRLYRDVHRYLRDLEEVLILLLSRYGLQAHREAGMTGVWAGDGKVASIGVKVSRWVTMHGFALNVNSDLSFFNGIIPCGLTGKEMVSMESCLGRNLSVEEVAAVTAECFGQVFQCRPIWVSLADLLDRIPDSAGQTGTGP